MTNIQNLLNVAQKAAIEAGQAIMNIYRSGNLGEALKGDRSPITKADQTAHAIISGVLAPTGLPILSEEGKEIGFEVRKDWYRLWLVDPLDGTKEFLQGRNEFTVNIALVIGGNPVAGVIYLPTEDILYSGAVRTGVVRNDKGRVTPFAALPMRRRLEDLRGQSHLRIAVSRSHFTAETKVFINSFPDHTLVQAGSSLKFISLVEGRADIYPRLGPTMEWDTAAAHAILHAAGMGIYEPDGRTELTYNKPNLVNPSFIAF